MNTILKMTVGELHFPTLHRPTRKPFHCVFCVTSLSHLIVGIFTTLLMSAICSLTNTMSYSSVHCLSCSSSSVYRLSHNHLVSRKCGLLILISQTAIVPSCSMHSSMLYTLDSCCAVSSKSEILEGEHK